MGKNLLLGVGGRARHVKALYVGVGGKARKIKKIYVGVGGKARLVWQDYVAVTSLNITHTTTSPRSTAVGAKLILDVGFVPSNATTRTLSASHTIDKSYPQCSLVINGTTITLTCTRMNGDSNAAVVTIIINAPDGIKYKVTAWIYNNGVVLYIPSPGGGFTTKDIPVGFSNVIITKI